MSGWTSSRVARALGVPDPAPCTFATIGTDTRALEEGALFVALTGARFDGHEYLEEARRRGARGAVVRRGTAPVEGLVSFEVDDTLVALGALATERRRDIRGPVVAVTGTNGKTSTKEMLAAALGTKWRVHATRGNLNNLVGVPLTILSAPPGTEALVVEAGASVPGEIARLRDIIQPDGALVTNVSAGHTEGFGSSAGVLEEKLSLLWGVDWAVVGTTPAELGCRAAEVSRHVTVAGLGGDAAVKPDRWRLREDGTPVLRFGEQTVRVPLVGRHQAENATLVLAVARHLRLDMGAVAEALAGVRLPWGRCEPIHRGGLLLIDDTYNANPRSVEASVDAAKQLRGARPMVVVLGSMLELGDESAAHHNRIADLVVEAEPALVGATGLFVAAFERHARRLGARLVMEHDVEVLGRRVAERLRGDELVLLKASRGVGLERVIPALEPGSET